MDARYDDFLAMIGPAGDANLFDDQGVTGMHAIERILYAPSIRQEVIDFEKTLPGYKAAAFPATAQEATDFKTKLCQKLIDDAQSLHDQWQPAAIDIGAAYTGLVGLMNEQKEKVNLAATGEEESATRTSRCSICATTSRARSRSTGCSSRGSRASRTASTPTCRSRPSSAGSTPSTRRPRRATRSRPCPTTGAPTCRPPRTSRRRSACCG